jgi:NAD(P)H-flavin reductase
VGGHKAHHYLYSRISNILNFMNRSEMLRPPAVPRAFRVKRVRRELSDTFTLELEGDGSSESTAYRPGQFNMLYAFGAGEIPISMSGDPAKTPMLVHTIRSVGGVSAALCRLKRGDAIGVRGPYGTGWPLDEGRGMDVIVVAGGIGMAPLRGAIYAIAGDRSAYGKVSLLFGARTPKDFLYMKELDVWRSKHNIDVQCTADTGDAQWTGHVGFVTLLAARLPFDPTRTIVMICGPEIMMKKIAGEFITRGLSSDAIYISMERNMKCALGFCGHCQFGPEFICKDGPVFQYSRIERFLEIREL